MASEEMPFENVDGRRTDGRTTDACLYYKLTYEPSARVRKKKRKQKLGGPFSLVSLELCKAAVSYIFYIDKPLNGCFIKCP